MKKATILAVILLMMFLSEAGFSACPSMDFTGDCKVDFKDFAVFVSQWLDEGIPSDPCNIVWVAIDDSGEGMKDEGGNPISYGGFVGEMAKYETGNSQYCDYLNAAISNGEIIVDANIVYGGDGTDYEGEIYFATHQANPKSQISCSDGEFSVIDRDGNSMGDHPVVMVSWYGAAVFCDYYNYRLPGQWEWQAVADYDGSFSYGCGLSIDVNTANYYASNPFGLSSYPYTSSIGYYEPYGYGMCDMAGNVREWTDSWYSSIESYRVIRGGGWYSYDQDCLVWYRSYNSPQGIYDDIGFRVCRDVVVPVAIPDVVGMLQADAETAITAVGFVVGAVTEQYNDTIAAGNVISQNPVAGEMFETGTMVDLVVSLGTDYSVAEIVWVSVSDSGEGMKDEDGNSISHGGFVGEISKYETRNGQYCKFLNDAKTDGIITVYNDVVYAVNDVNYAWPYIETYAADLSSQIDYQDGEFSVASRDGYYMGSHPVVCVSWYGAAAFCDYYGYSLPTQWQWQAVADYDGSYVYGCGVSIDPNKANYDSANPLGLSGYPYTSPVSYYPAYGYGICDMAGGVWEWTQTDSVLRGGSWVVSCTVSHEFSIDMTDMVFDVGFRVCRNVSAISVPDVVDMSQADAEAAIEAVGFVVGVVTEEYSYTVADGNVVSQDPSAGELLEAEGVVDLVVSLGGDPSGIVWVDINDPGVAGHESFVGEMSKYEISNDQYCDYLNAGIATGEIIIDSNVVYGGVGGDYDGEVCFDTRGADPESQIVYLDGEFSVVDRDANSMGNHPVVCVSWYGAKLFCGHYGYSLPTEWQWQAVADYDDSYTYGCGTTINSSKANYNQTNPLGLSSPPYTSPVGYYPSYGYGMCDMAGNVWEWVDSWSSSSPGKTILCGGGWNYYDNYCEVSYRFDKYPNGTLNYAGFRVCR